MKTGCLEFEPLEVERATRLREMINDAGRNGKALVIEPDERGITSSIDADLLSPNEDTNALVRYRRHY